MTTATTIEHDVVAAESALAVRVVRRRGEQNATRANIRGRLYPIRPVEIEDQIEPRGEHDRLPLCSRRAP
jgi:hypothetical protein